MKNELQMMLLDTKSNTITKQIVNNELDAYYNLLDCDCIDITARRVRGTYFDIICDDEGLLKDDPVISAISISGFKPEPMLFGNLLFCHHDDEGETTALSDGECELIENSVTEVYTSDGKEHLVVVLEY